MSARPSRPVRAALVLTLVIAVVLVVVAMATGRTPPESPSATATSGHPVALTVDQLPAPVDLDPGSAPRFGWQLTAGYQQAYQVQVSTTSGQDTADLWDSGRIQSPAGSDRPYLGPPLGATGGYYWRVRTWDRDGLVSAWSPESRFGTGPGSSWSDSSPIWAGSDGTWRDYTFAGDFIIRDEAIGLLFRAKDEGNHYLWQFRSDTRELVRLAAQGGVYTELGSSPLPADFVADRAYAFRIVTSGSVVTTWLDGQLIDTSTVGGEESGVVGVRTGLGESGEVSGLTVTDPDGESLHREGTASVMAELDCAVAEDGVNVVGPHRICLAGLDWIDQTIEVTLRIQEGAAGIVLRAQDARHYYLWQLKTGPDGQLVSIVRDEHTFTPVKDPVFLGRPILVNTDYRLRIEIRGDVFRTFLDDRLVDTVTDSTYAVGPMGMRTGAEERFSVNSVRATRPDGTVLGPEGPVDARTGFSCADADDGGTLSMPIGTSCLYNAANHWAFLRGQVMLEPAKEVAWAHLYATASSVEPTLQYVYKLSINGSFVGVGPTRSAAGVTRYDGYDVTALLRPGRANVVGALAYTPADQRFQAELVVHYTDGTDQTFGTDGRWQALSGDEALPSAGSIGTSYYDAPRENFDARVYPFGFDMPGYAAGAWSAATIREPFALLAGTPTAKLVQKFPEPVDVQEVSPGSYRIDYGRTWIGGLNLHLDGISGQRVEIRYGPVRLADGSVSHVLPGGNNFRDVWTLTDGAQDLQTWGIRAFRYVDIVGAPTGLTAADLPAVALVQPTSSPPAQFSSSDAELDSVWQLSANTIEGANGNLYVDTWEREREPYEADAYLQLLANLYTSGDATLGNYTIDFLLPGRTWPTEWPLLLILAAHESYRATGDLTVAAAAYDELVGKLPGRYFDAERGLVGKVKGSDGDTNCIDCDLVDWPMAERDGFVFGYYNTVVNAMAYAAYAAMADLATDLGHSGDATNFGRRAATIRSSMNTLLWDQEAKAYRDGLDASGTPIDHHAIQAGVFPVALGVPDAALMPAAVDAVADRAMSCSVYCTAFLVAGEYAGGRADAAHAMLTDDGPHSWLHMIDQGVGSTMEAWDRELKQNISYSHPWGASPAFNVPRGLFGIAPIEPGYARFTIAPQVDAVDWAAITVPTVKGTVGVAFAAENAGVPEPALQVRVPGNATAEVHFPYESMAPEVEPTVYLDGAAVPTVQEDGYLRLDDVGPGCHTLALTPGPVTLVGVPDICT